MDDKGDGGARFAGVGRRRSAFRTLEPAGEDAEGIGGIACEGLAEDNFDEIEGSFVE
jgi:hypothetical protein